MHLSPIKTTEEWMQIFEACCLSGLSIRRWCKENQISENAYRYWYSKICKNQSAVSIAIPFAEIPVAPQIHKKSSESYSFRIHYKEFRIDLDPSADVCKLAETMKALSAL